MKRLLLSMMAVGGLAAMVWREYPTLQRYLRIKGM